MKLGRSILAPLALTLVCATRPWAADTAPVDPAALEAEARVVYADLVRAAGDDRRAPDLAVAAMPDAPVALFDQDQHRITVEPKALAVCAGFGAEAPNAMAALLGHELAHFYLGHSCRSDFGGLDGGGVDLKLRTDAEAQADRQAGFYAYMAGYPTAGVFPDLLSALYQAYGLPERMLGYPSLSQRRRQAAQAEALLKPDWWAFEAGKRLLLLDRPEDAILAFDKTAEDFPSREVLCGAALARMLAAQKSLGPDLFPWLLPALLSPRSRAATSVSLENGDDEAQQRQTWLSEAVDLLQRAKLKQPGYRAASLDLACAYVLQGRLEAAEAEAADLETASKVAGDAQTALGASVVQALCQAQAGHRNQAKEALNRLDKSQPWVSRNLDLLEPGGEDQDSFDMAVVADPDEALGGWQPMDRSTWTQADWDWTQIAPPQGDTLNLYHSEGAGVFALRCVRGADEDTVAVTRPQYAGRTTRGIKIGSDEAAVRKAYGSPERMFATDEGTYLFFRRIAFLVRNKTVTEWMLF